LLKGIGGVPSFINVGLLRKAAGGGTNTWALWTAAGISEKSGDLKIGG
jgi:hypothetical protein